MTPFVTSLLSGSKPQRRSSAGGARGSPRAGTAVSSALTPRAPRPPPLSHTPAAQSAARECRLGVPRRRADLPAPLHEEAFVSRRSGPLPSRELLLIHVVHARLAAAAAALRWRGLPGLESPPLLLAPAHGQQHGAARPGGRLRAPRGPNRPPKAALPAPSTHPPPRPSTAPRAAPPRHLSTFSPPRGALPLATSAVTHAAIPPPRSPAGPRQDGGSGSHGAEACGAEAGAGSQPRHPHPPRAAPSPRAAAPHPLDHPRAAAGPAGPGGGAAAGARAGGAGHRHVRGPAVLRARPGPAALPALGPRLEGALAQPRAALRGHAAAQGARLLHLPPAGPHAGRYPRCAEPGAAPAGVASARGLERCVRDVALRAGGARIWWSAAAKMAPGMEQRHSDGPRVGAVLPGDEGAPGRPEGSLSVLQGGL